MRFKRTVLVVAMAAMIVVMGSACNTMRGVGKDIQRAGEKIQQWTH